MFNIYRLTLFFQIFTTISSAKLFMSRNIFQHDFPSNLTHDPRSEICCNGIIHNRPSANHLCCYDKIYDKSSQSCCNGEIYDSKTHTCCLDFDRTKYSKEFGKSLYGSDLRPVEGQGKIYCCGDKIVNIKTESCYDGIVYQKKGSSTCGNVACNSATELCCDRVLFQNGNGSLACCGDKAFDTKAEVCCDYEIKGKAEPEDNDCCNGKSYNKETHVCCTNSIVAKTDVTHSRCCGAVSYGKGQGCCNGIIFDRKSEMCCDDVVAKGNGKKDLCCGKSAYNKDSQVCCNEVIYGVGDGVCCRWKFHSGVKKGDGSCCGVEFLRNDEKDSNKGVCCKGGSKEKCCGFKLFDSSTQNCCGNYVLEKNGDNKVGCCTVTDTIHEITMRFRQKQ